MSANTTTLRPLGQPGDLGWVVMAHGEVYSEEFGWDASFEALVARIVADYAGRHDPRREAAWIAEVDGRRAGCVFCVTDPERTGTALLRILLVHPDGRGRDLGRRLVGACLEFARTPAMSACDCGPITRLPPLGTSTSSAGSGWSRRPRITASASTWSARPTNSIWCPRSAPPVGQPTAPTRPRADRAPLHCRGDRRAAGHPRPPRHRQADQGAVAGPLERAPAKAPLALVGGGLEVPPARKGECGVLLVASGGAA